MKGSQMTYKTIKDGNHKLMLATQDDKQATIAVLPENHGSPFAYRYKANVRPLVKLRKTVGRLADFAAGKAFFSLKHAKAHNKYLLENYDWV